jgi:hypothetical protein
MRIQFSADGKSVSLLDVPVSTRLTEKGNTTIASTMGNKALGTFKTKAADGKEAEHIVMVGFNAYVQAPLAGAAPAKPSKK